MRRLRGGLYGKCGAAVVVLLAVAALFLFPGDGVSVTPPAPDARAARICTKLAAALPDAVAGGKRRTTDPASPYTAAWGEAPIVLRCGVERPAQMLNPQAPGFGG